jgi:hypothetical protein
LQIAALQDGSGAETDKNASTSSKPFSYEPFPTAGVVAYFSMEIAINPGMPTYSGGLGVLAGDTLRSAADLGVPLVAFTLAHRKGYFQQHLDARACRARRCSRGIRRISAPRSRRGSR